MNVKAYKDAVALKCRQCVGQESIKYKADSRELIDVCSRTTCGLHKLRPRIQKQDQSVIEEIMAEICK
jgi:hypothetical protein